jgi:hypothetical protein
MPVRRRRPVSYFMLLAIPVVLLLGLQLAMHRDDPRRFAMVLSLLFAFFGFALLHAVLDLFAIARKRLRDERDVYRSTLGASDFSRELGRRVNARKRP